MLRPESGAPQRSIPCPVETGLAPLLRPRRSAQAQTEFQR
jgi:hypothetical protein